jgi:hypothetical protein
VCAVVEYRAAARATDSRKGERGSVPSPWTMGIVHVRMTLHERDRIRDWRRVEHTLTRKEKQGGADLFLTRLPFETGVGRNVFFSFANGTY